MDTIFALSSGSVPSAVGIVRVSGPDVRFGLETIVGILPQPRTAKLCSLQAEDGSIIDRALVVYFPGPQSFTGEDCAEFHLHGGRAVVLAMMNRLSALNGYRSAEPGEFTRRAFENGKMDLTEVEGLSDLIAAQTEMQRRMAIDQSGGRLSHLYGGWRVKMIRARALIEAEFDFADEEDIPGSVSDKVWLDMAALAKDIKSHLKGSAAGEIIRDGYRIVILGAPNSGKSSLLNALAQRDVAIVSDELGTTRDILELNLDLSGYSVTVMDTAGLRESAGNIEKEGMRRARAAASSADLILLLEDTKSPVAVDTVDIPEDHILRVGTKIDLVQKPDACGYDCCISVLSQQSLDDLIELIGGRLEKAVASPFDVLPTRQRHREYLISCLKYLNAAIDNSELDLELRSEELRLAGEQLGRLTGRFDVEDLLDAIFSEFCVGK